MMTAKEFLAHHYAGLAIWGWNTDEHELEWVGSDEQWQRCGEFLVDEDFPEDNLNYPIKQF